jgi:hypothetical protein
MRCRITEGVNPKRERLASTPKNDIIVYDFHVNKKAAKAAFLILPKLNA